MNTARYLKETPILNYSHNSFQKLSQEKKWSKLPEYERIGAIYHFVQNHLIFGYNKSDEIPASEVLEDGYGQCNTKGSLLMALFRQHGIPCRFHGFTIDKELQKGAITGLFYLMAPKSIIHSWVEIFFQGEWINLEGFILDKQYLKSLQRKFSDTTGSFSGYGVATTDFKNPSIDWEGKSTYIQKEGINQDFNIFDSPDEFYQEHGSNLSGLKKTLYQHWIRKRMNVRVDRIRKEGVTQTDQQEIACVTS